MAKPQILEEVGKVSELKTNDKTVVGGINEVLEKEKSNAEQINILSDERGYLNIKGINGVSVNAIIENGKYRIDNCTDIPDGASACYTLDVTCYSVNPLYCYQKAECLLGTYAGKTIERYCLNGSFSEWREVCTSKSISTDVLTFYNGFSLFPDTRFNSIERIGKLCHVSILLTGGTPSSIICDVPIPETKSNIVYVNIKETINVQIRVENGKISYNSPQVPPSSYWRLDFWYECEG